jgi:hypothetical protein
MRPRLGDAGPGERRDDSLRDPGWPWDWTAWPGRHPLDVREPAGRRTPAQDGLSAGQRKLTGWMWRITRG